MRLAAFAALGFYGAVRWASLLSPAPVLRLLGLLAVAVALAAIGQRVTRYRRIVIPVVSVLAVLLILPLAGIPVRWVTHLRVAVTADAIGSGLSAMPGALVPYDGVNEWLRWVIVIGAGLLLVAAGLILASAPKPLGEGRRAAAALLLVALAIVPSTIVRPSLPYLQGLILFVLVAGFMWGERLRSGEMLMATVLAVLAGAAGMIAAPRLDPHSPWLNYEALAGDLAPAHPEAFDWRQSYGPLHWPRTGHEVLDVQAQHPDYWKAENLDVFDGRGWVDASVGGVGPPIHDPARHARALDADDSRHAPRDAHVERDRGGRGRGARAHAGLAGRGPERRHLAVAAANLGPGDSYTVSSYDPHPRRPRSSMTAGTGYPDAILPAYLTLFVPTIRPDRRRRPRRPVPARRRFRRPTSPPGRRR